MRISLTIIILLLCFPFTYGQKIDSAEIKSFRRFVPYMIEGVKVSSIEIDNKVSNSFNKPWEALPTADSTVEKILNDLVSNAAFELNSSIDPRLAYNVSNLNEDMIIFRSYLSNPYNSIDEIEKRDKSLSTLRLLVSDFNFFNEGSTVNLFISRDMGLKTNENYELEFRTGKVKTYFPVKKGFNPMKGSFKISLKKLTQFEYEHIKPNRENTTVSLTEKAEPIEIIEFDKNRVLLKLSTPNINYKIIATDKDDRTFLTNWQLNVPIEVFEFATSKALTEPEISEFTSQLSIEDVASFKDKPTIRIIETNGIIDNLYIYKNIDSIILGSRKIKVEL